MRTHAYSAAIIIQALALAAGLLACQPRSDDGAPEALTDHGAASPALANVVSSEGFVDKVIAGYQGWFTAKGDGSPIGGWSHWSPTIPAPGKVSVELYPDTRDYHPDDLHETELGPLGDGRPSALFGSYSAGVVDTHFEWMEQAGIDGVALQRFVTELDSPKHFAHRNKVASNVRASAEKHGRIFHLTYDISGAKETTLLDSLAHDWTDVIEGELGLTSSSAYARQDGRPVVLLWGFGFPDRPGTPEQAVAAAAWFKNHGCYVAAGVPHGWRSGDDVKPGFLDVWSSFDMIQPWAVGAAANDLDIDSHFAHIVKSDKQWATSHGLDYQRVIFPGFAWSNWNGGAPNMIPRRAGQFFWHQAYQVRAAGIGAFVAMFDEYDEGTAIAKAAEDASMIPTAQYFLTLDADGTHVSSDYYLRLAGAATRMIRGEAPHDAAIPIPFVVSESPPPPPGPGPGTPPALGGEPVPPQDAYSPTVKSFTASEAKVIVERLYRALLGREVDPSGLNAYAPPVQSGGLAGVVTALLTSAEFEARRPGLTTVSMAEELYSELLDRPSDPGGSSETANQILQRQAAARTVAMILSPEYVEKN